MQSYIFQQIFLSVAIYLDKIFLKKKEIRKQDTLLSVQWGASKVRIFRQKGTPEWRVYLNTVAIPVRTEYLGEESSMDCKVTGVKIRTRLCSRTKKGERDRDPKNGEKRNQILRLAEIFFFSFRFLFFFSFFFLSPQLSRSMAC